VDYVLFAILGLTGGAVISFIAIAVLIGYRGSGVLNFAQGAIAMYVAYEYYDLRVNGDYFQPVPGLPNPIAIKPGGLSFAPSILLALATAAVLGLLSHLLVFRPLRRAPALASVVASVGVLLILQSVVTMRFGTTPVSVPQIFPSGTAFSLFGVHFPKDRAWLVLIVALLGIAGWAVYKYTRFGLATRASAENERGAVLIGLSPDFQAGISWVLAALIAGLGGILVSPVTSLSPTGFTFVIIPAFAAVLAGRFRSFSITVAAGLAIGMAQSLFTNLPAKISWFPQTGVADLVPFVVIVALMFSTSKSIPTREMLAEARLPAAPVARRPLLSGAIALAGAVILLFALSGGYRLAFINSLIGVLVCASLVVLVGYLGQISLFQMALAGVSAFMLARFTTEWGVPFPVAPILAVLVAAAFGLVAALPALRLRGVSLAVVTLAAGWSIEQIWFNNYSLNGGYSGAVIAKPSLFGIDLSFTRGTDIGQMSFCMMVLVVVAAVGFAVMNIRRSHTGRRMLAIRSNERAAAAVGISVARTKLLGFTISALIAGVAGALLGYEQQTVSASSFDILASVTFLAVAYLGGITSMSGAVAGGVLATGGLGFYIIDVLVLNHLANGLQLQGAVAGIGLILTAILNQEGIAGAVRQSSEKLLRRKSAPPPDTAQAMAVAERTDSVPAGPGGVS
jgi:ABC-type branched-subunit amino acid transport system permease subunit